MTTIVLSINLLAFMVLFVATAWDWIVLDTEEAIIPSVIAGSFAIINIVALTVG